MKVFEKEREKKIHNVEERKETRSKKEEHQED